MSNAVSINGLGSFRTRGTPTFAASDVLVFLDSAGNLWAENPFVNAGINGTFVVGTGKIIQLENPAVHITPGTFMDTATAYSILWMTLSDLKVGTGISRKFYLSTTANRFEYDSIGYPNNATALGPSIPSTDAGDIAIGTRYAVTMFVTRSGYITGWDPAAVTKIVVTTANRKLYISGIPVAPITSPQVVSRIVAFTQAGASSSGPYFYVPTDDIIEGLNAAPNANGNNITSTVINDNTTTDLFVTFPDEYLIGSVDVTTFADKGAGFQSKSVYYSKTLRRLIWCGVDDY